MPVGRLRGHYLAHAYRESQHFAVALGRGGDVLHADGDVVDALDLDGHAPLVFRGLAGWTGKKRASTSLRLELRLRGAELNAYDAVR